MKGKFFIFISQNARLQGERLPCDNTTYSKIKRLIDDGKVVIFEENVEDGHIRKKYRKVNQMLL